ncbi:MAG: hypothetical protein GTO33_13705 [Acidobacteria bacterium]|nr:hypothetical protein [Acidobacteriota bacterium]NIO60361.1 hypothetical protein [Acidobacteriota bacterium]NIQ86677.1 hypothetical protein [Acidobacteriota bacterium]NIT12034.1 hypothetical protein [Acidobacteriota bacterium]
MKPRLRTIAKWTLRLFLVLLFGRWSDDVTRSVTREQMMDWYTSRLDLTLRY